VKPETKNEFLEWTAEVQCGELIRRWSRPIAQIRVCLRKRDMWLRGI